MLFAWTAIKAFFSFGKIFGLLGKLAGFCLEHWKPLSIILLILGNVIQWEWYWPRKVAHWQEQHAIVAQQLAECEGSRAELKDEIASVNNQVDQWAAVSQGLQQSHDTLTAELAKLKADSAVTIQDILSAPTPESCEAAIQFLRDAIGEELKWQRPQ